MLPTPIKHSHDQLCPIALPASLWVCNNIKNPKDFMLQYTQATGNRNSLLVEHGTGMEMEGILGVAVAQHCRN